MNNEITSPSSTGQATRSSKGKTEKASSIIFDYYLPQTGKPIKPINGQMNYDVSSKETSNPLLGGSCNHFKGTDTQINQLMVELLAFQRVFLGKLASLVATRNSQESIIDISPDESVMEVKDREWLTVDETSLLYRLPKNNIKNRKWRVENDFPYKGYDENKKPYSRVIFHSKDIEAWIKTHKR